MEKGTPSVRIPREQKDWEHAEPAVRVWVDYAQRKFGAEFRHHECELHLDELVATQSEIELVKYRLVREEGFRADEPIMVYRGRLGTSFIVDGHTRARVKWDLGERTVTAIVLSATNVELDAEFARIADAVGGGKTMHIRDVPIADRIGEGSEAWEKRRAELRRDWKLGAAYKLSASKQGQQ
ncbi:MAG TPA: hypothetical protein VNE39_02695 [Planctomycetota bacterium]|nr:hypothetical protein [Planctomycetota bacterium]